jgi:hypothetical protein
MDKNVRRTLRLTAERFARDLKGKVNVVILEQE